MDRILTAYQKIEELIHQAISTERRLLARPDAYLQSVFRFSRESISSGENKDRLQKLIGMRDGKQSTFLVSDSLMSEEIDMVFSAPFPKMRACLTKLKTHLEDETIRTLIAQEMLSLLAENRLPLNEDETPYQKNLEDWQEKYDQMLESLPPELKKIVGAGDDLACLISILRLNSENNLEFLNRFEALENERNTLLSRAFDEFVQKETCENFLDFCIEQRPILFHTLDQVCGNRQETRLYLLEAIAISEELSSGIRVWTNSSSDALICAWEYSPEKANTIHDLLYDSREKTFKLLLDLPTLSQNSLGQNLQTSTPRRKAGQRKATGRVYSAEFQGSPLYLEALPTSGEYNNCGFNALNVSRQEFVNTILAHATEEDRTRIGHNIFALALERGGLIQRFHQAYRLEIYRFNQRHADNILAWDAIVREIRQNSTVLATSHITAASTPEEIQIALAATQENSAVLRRLRELVNHYIVNVHRLNQEGAQFFSNPIRMRNFLNWQIAGSPWMLEMGGENEEHSGILSTYLKYRQHPTRIYVWRVAKDEKGNAIKDEHGQNTLELSVELGCDETDPRITRVHIFHEPEAYHYQATQERPRPQNNLQGRNVERPKLQREHSPIRRAAARDATQRLAEQSKNSAKAEREVAKEEKAGILVSKAEKCNDKENWDEAIKLCNQALKLAPDSIIGARAHRGKAYYFKENYKEAAEDYEIYLESDPDHSSSHFYLAIIYSRLGKFKESIDHCLKAIKLGLGQKDIYFTLGFAYAGDKQYQKALSAYTKAIDFEGDTPDAVDYFNRGEVYWYLKHYDAAISDFTAAIELSQAEDSESYFMRGRAYAANNQVEEAQQDFEKVLELDPQHSKAKQELKKQLSRKRELEEDESESSSSEEPPRKARKLQVSAVASAMFNHSESEEESESSEEEEEYSEESSMECS